MLILFKPKPTSCSLWYHQTILSVVFLKSIRYQQHENWIHKRFCQFNRFYESKNDAWNFVLHRRIYSTHLLFRIDFLWGKLSILISTASWFFFEFCLQFSVPCWGSYEKINSEQTFVSNLFHDYYSLYIC